VDIATDEKKMYVVPILCVMCAHVKERNFITPSFNMHISTTMFVLNHLPESSIKSSMHFLPYKQPGLVSTRAGPAEDDPPLYK